MAGQIKAYPTTKSGPETASEMTFTPGAGDKSSLDIFIQGALSQILDLSNVLIKGTLPEVNFNQIIKETVSSTAHTLAFAYNGSVQFYIDATSLDSDYNVIIRETDSLTLQRGISRLQLESSTDTLGLESS